MSQAIWTQCEQEFKFSSYGGMPWRVVEAQHVIATRKLVDSDEEQQILEDLIEAAKPPRPYDEGCTRYHYLIWTPFRYPPLKHGLRFGSMDRKGLWYGSEGLETAFSEKAYYTFLFRSGSTADFGTFDATITAFCIHVQTKACAKLTQPPFLKFEKELSSPASYVATQPLGSALRDHGAEIICFKSARCPSGGTNLAVTGISVFQDTAPRETSTWFCTSSAQTVEFKPSGFQTVSATRTVFNKSDFEIAGKFPAPAV